MTPASPGHFVSRGGDKLDGALTALDIDVDGVRALDAGASTGGFTDCLLRRGAREVVAVDVAYGQFAWTLRIDPRVRVVERTNIRTFVIDEPVDLVVADLSFVSLAGLADALVACARDDGDLLLMVKPQFELPRARVPRGGVVSDPAAWIEACEIVAATYRARGCVLGGAASSGLPGPKGNREFFIHLARSGEDAGDGVLAAAVRSAP